MLRNRCTSPMKKIALIHGRSNIPAQASSLVGEDFNPRGYRRGLGATNKYTHKFLNDPDAKRRMEDEGIGYSMTGLVAQIKEKYFAHTEEGVTIKLAESYGFCWGIERAVTNVL